MTKKKKTETKKKINSKSKGKRGERYVAKRLREYGFDAKRGVQYQGSPDSPDVIGLRGVHIEVKFTERLNMWSALEQSKRDAGEGEVPVVMFKRNRSDVYVTMPLDDFVDFYKAWIREKTGAEQQGLQGYGQVPERTEPVEKH